MKTKKIFIIRLLTVSILLSFILNGCEQIDKVKGYFIKKEEPKEETTTEPVEEESELPVAFVDDIPAPEPQEPEPVVEEKKDTLDYNLILRSMIEQAEGKNIIFPIYSFKNLLNTHAKISDAEYWDITEVSDNSIFAFEKIWDNSKDATLPDFGFTDESLFPIDMGVNIGDSDPTNDKNNYINEKTGQRIISTNSVLSDNQIYNIEEIAIYDINIDVDVQQLVPASYNMLDFTQYDGQKKALDYYVTKSNYMIETDKSKNYVLPLKDGYKVVFIRNIDEDTDINGLFTKLNESKEPITKANNNIFLPSFDVTSYIEPDYQELGINKGVYNQELTKLGDIKESMTVANKMDHVEEITEYDMNDPAADHSSDVYYTEPFVYIVLSTDNTPLFMGLIQNFDGLIGSDDVPVSGQYGMDRWDDVNKELEDQYQTSLAGITISDATGHVKKYSYQKDDEEHTLYTYFTKNDIDMAIYKYGNDSGVSGLQAPEDKDYRIVDYETFEDMWRYYSEDKANPYYGMYDKNFIVHVSASDTGWVDANIIDVVENDNNIAIYRRETVNGNEDNKNGILFVIPTDKSDKTLISTIDVLKPMELGKALRSALYPSTEDTGYFNAE